MRVRGAAREPIGGQGLGGQLDTLRPGPADVDVADGRVEGYEIPETVPEPRRPETDPPSDEVLLDSGVPTRALLGLEVLFPIGPQAVGGA